MDQTIPNEMGSSDAMLCKYGSKDPLRTNTN